MAPFLKTYVPYLSKIKWILYQIGELRRTDVKFRQLLKRKEALKIDSIESLVIKPAQRLPQ